MAMTKLEILHAVKSGTLSLESAEALLVDKKAAPPITVKLQEKGTVSVYGLGKWPTTLYPAQWRRLIDNIGKVTEFLDKLPQTAFVNIKTAASKPQLPVAQGDNGWFYDEHGDTMYGDVNKLVAKYDTLEGPFATEADAKAARDTMVTS